MALETLKNLVSIDGFSVLQLLVERGEAGNENDMPVQQTDYIVIDHSENSIKFKIQQGGIGESGINGCQVDSMISVSLAIIRGLNQKFPCRENSIAITKLEEALHWLQTRKSDREKRGVEGLNKE